MLNTSTNRCQTSTATKTASAQDLHIKSVLIQDPYSEDVYQMLNPSFSLKQKEVVDFGTYHCLHGNKSKGPPVKRAPNQKGPPKRAPSQKGPWS
jgi:hypothetical protein